MNLRGREQARRSVRTCRNTGAAPDARRGVEGVLHDLVLDGHRVGLGFRAGVDGDVAAGLNHPVKTASIDDEILDDRKGAGAEGFDRDLGLAGKVIVQNKESKKITSYLWDSK